jgi:hypothetical protein
MYFYRMYGDSTQKDTPDGSFTKQPKMLTPGRTMGDEVKGGAEREKCGPATTGQVRKPKLP